MGEKQGHTPGEWKVFQCLSSDTMLPGRGIEINGKSYWLGLDAHNADANARLIASSPALLEALQELMEPHDEGRDDNWDGKHKERLAAARAAISKATGVPNAQ